VRPRLEFGSFMRRKGNEVGTTKDSKRGIVWRFIINQFKRIFVMNSGEGRRLMVQIVRAVSP
jgi:hypothetical protein